MHRFEKDWQVATLPCPCPTSFLRYSVKQDWNLIDLFAMKFWNTLFQIEFWQKSLGSIYSLVSIWEADKKVNFRTVMVQPLGVELCNFPIWYDKGIIDLVTLISNLLLHWRIKKRFSAPCFSTFFLLVYVTSPLLSLQIINGQMLIFAHLLSKTRACTPFDTDLEKGSVKPKKLENGWTNPDQTTK